MPTTPKTDARREFVVHSTLFGVLTNHQEVWDARREGRTAAGVPHYFKKGDRIALSQQYLERFGTAKQLTAPPGQLPALEPVEIFELRQEVEGKQAEADRASDKERGQLGKQLRAAQAALQAEYNRYQGATLLDQFTPDPQPSAPTEKAA